MQSPTLPPPIRRSRVQTSRTLGQSHAFGCRINFRKHFLAFNWLLVEMKCLTTDIRDHGLERPIMNGVLSHRDRQTRASAPAETACQGQATQSCVSSPHHRDQGSSRPGFPMAMLWGHLSITPQSVVPLKASVQGALPEGSSKQHSYYPQCVNAHMAEKEWIYTGCRAGELRIWLQRSPQRPGLKIWCEETLGGDSVRPVLKPSPLERPLRVR